MKKIKKIILNSLFIILLFVFIPLPNKASYAANDQKILYSGIKGGGNSNQAAVFTMNKDGSDKTDLTNIEDSEASSFPMWSPNGKKILYISFDFSSSTSPALMIMDRDGNNKKQLNIGMANDEVVISDFAWSKDSSKIFFPTTKTNYQNQTNPTLEEGSTKVYSVPVDGSSSPNQIAYFEPNSTSKYLRPRIEYNNKTDKLIIVLNTNNRATGEGANSTWKSFSINQDGSGTAEELMPETSGDLIDFSVSNSGSKILYSSEKYIGDGVNLNISSDYIYPLIIQDMTTLDSNTISENHGLWLYGSMPWSNNEDKIFASVVSRGIPYTAQNILSTSGTLVKDTSIAGTLFYPMGQFIDNDTRLLMSIVNDGSQTVPNEYYIAIYDIDSGQIADLSSGGEIQEFYASLSTVDTDTDTNSPEPTFTDPPKPPRTGLTSWVGIALMVTLGFLTLVGHLVARSTSKRLHSVK